MQRKTFLAASATAAALAASACARGSADQLELVEPAKEFDYAGFASRVAKPGAEVRQLWDVSSNPPVALSGIKNAFNGYRFGYALAPSRIAIVGCLHNEGNMIAYDDAAWQKYSIGQMLGLKDAQGNPIAKNIFVQPRHGLNAQDDPNDLYGMYQDPTLGALQHRGVVFTACHLAVAEHARMIAANGNAPAGANAEGIMKDLLDHIVPGVIVVPSGVATIGLLQTRFHYGYTAALT